ncbi:MAG: hypothetical protein ABI824_14260, partial [Acidobacteriota bacterium]
VWPKTPRLADQNSNVTLLRPANGTFTINNYPPGQYYVVAWEDVDQQLVQNPDFLARFASAATSFRLVEGDNQTIDPKWISKAASDRVAERFPD